MPNSVRDNAAEQRYEMDIEGKSAFITYRRQASVMTLVHAEVPHAEFVGDAPQDLPNPVGRALVVAVVGEDRALGRFGGGDHRQHGPRRVRSRSWVATSAQAPVL